MSFYNESLAALEARLQTILPELYQDCYEDVQAVSMGSASLKYDKNGKVAWDEMWGSFCDLAMAGGPPHKGTLLRPGTAVEIDAEPHRYQEVVREICRGIALVADLKAKLSKFPGWLRVECGDEVMAEWLVRAIVMENISAHGEGAAVFLPAGPAYRIEKEIKNVVTVMAKTCHYWVDHMWMSQQRRIAALFAAMAVETPLLGPPFPETACLTEGHHSEDLGPAIYRQVGFQATGQLQGWLGLACPSVSAAIWIMRGMVASNVLSRREGTTLFVPLNEKNDPSGKRVAQTVAHLYTLARTKGIA